MGLQIFDESNEYKLNLDQYAREVQSDDTYTYYAHAVAGSALSAAVWQAYRVNSDGDVLFANLGAFDQIATDLTVLIYGNWTPEFINPTAWYDASDSATITESSGSVSQWDDKSGNGKHLTQGTGASQPTTESVTIGGLNAIDFDGVDDVMSITGNINQAGDYCVVGVFHRYSAGDDLVITGDASTGNNYDFDWYTDNKIYSRPWGDAAASGDANTSTGDFLFGFIKVDSGKTYNRILNGESEKSGSWTTEVAGPLDQVGRYGASGESRMKLAELVYYTDTTEATRQKIEGYLAHKWSLTDNIPSDHPYKTEAP